MTHFIPHGLALLKRTGRFAFVVFFIVLFPFSASSETILRMVGPEDIGGAWAEIIGNFHREQKGIRVEYMSGPWSTDERQNMYVRSFLGGDPIEIVYLDVIWTARFAQQGWILPLDRWFPPEKRVDFIPADIEAGLYQGHFYRVPMRSDVGVLYYRKDLIPAPPETWSDFERLCQEFSHPPDRYGIVFQGMQYEGLTCNFLEYLWGAGGEVFDPEGHVLLDSAESLAALGLMKKIVDRGWAPRGVVSFQEQHSLEFFQNRTTLFMRNWPYAWRILSSSPLKGKVAVAPLFRRRGLPAAGTLGGWGLGIAKGIESPEKAWKFIDFATSAASQRILHDRRGAVPSRKSLLQGQEILEESPHYRDLYPLLLTARPRPVHPEYARISDSIQKRVSAVLVGTEEPEDAVPVMGRSVKNVIEGKKLGWFTRFLMDYELRVALRNTALFTIFSVPFEMILGFGIALLINAPLKARAVSRLSVLVPWALPTAVMAMAWQWMFSNPFGVINDLLVRTTLLHSPIDWLSSPGGAMFAVVFADIWKTMPFVAIILLAGLQSIPKELEESFSVDGGGFLKELCHLVIPLLLPFIRTALIFRLIHAAGIFDLIWVLTKGGPADSTRTLSLYIYDLAFRYGEIGYGLFLTLLFVLCLVILSLIVVQATTLRHERVSR